MPKKMNYQEELKTLKSVPDSSLRPVTTRVPVNCLRKLYQLCDRDNLDLSPLVRQILEDQADRYLQQATGRAGSGRSSIWPQSGTCKIHLDGETEWLARIVCEEMAIELPTLIHMILFEALPEWALRAEKAQKQRQLARARLENRPTPEMASWDAYCRVAHAAHAASLRAVRALIEEGVVELELGTNAVLRLTSNSEATISPETSDEDHELKVLQDLTAAGVLVFEGIGDDTRKTWRLEPQVLLTKSKAR
jgi:hypothetical protein